MAEIFGRFQWPGMVGAFSGIYTLSAGTTAGVACIHCNPQDTLFAESGDLIITDNNTVLRVPGCKVDRIREEKDKFGRYWVVDIFDWRWRWKDCGSLNGEYNQTDNHNKLIPWTIRSPKELAILCLNAMGVKKYEIDLPTGLTRSVGEQAASLNPPWVGVIPTRGTNPAVSWSNVPPAQALDELVSRYGRRIVPRLSDYTICIVLPGFGAALPDGSIFKHALALDSPETPLGVGVIGNPTRYQGRFVFEAVGLEWDGSYRPKDELSYAPYRVPAVDVWTATLLAITDSAPGDYWSVRIVTSNGEVYVFEYTATGVVPAATVTAALTALINASPVATQVTAAADAGAPSNLTFTAVNGAEPFTVEVSQDLVLAGTASFTCVNTTVGSDGKADWSGTSPVGNPAFPALGDLSRTAWDTVTSRLTFIQAQELAKKSVYCSYRLKNVDASGSGPINIPGYGLLKRRQQVILQNTKVEQARPLPSDLTLTVGNVQGTGGLPYVVDFYNGYSRDLSPVAYGSHFWGLDRVVLTTTTPNNSAPDDRILVPFSVDPEQQVITFDQPIFKWVNGKFTAPDIVIETGCLIRNEETNELECFKASLLNPGAKGFTNLVVRKYPDVQLNVIGKYRMIPEVDGSGATISVTHVLDSTNELEDHPRIASGHYLKGLQAQYFPNASEIRGYNGFMAINLDGAIQQTTWSFGSNGCETIASRNTEHSVFIEPMPARRRSEFLAPAMTSNLREAAIPSRIGERMYLGNTGR